MTRPLPPHGTTTRYKRGCRCQPCRDAVAAYQRHRYRQTAYGRWQPRVDAEPVREHALMLLRHLTVEEAARLAGVKPDVLRQVAHGKPSRAPSRTIRAEAARRILATRPALDRLAPEAMVAADGTRRRLQALAVGGWTLRTLADESGVPWGTLRDARDGDYQYVRARTAAAVRDAFERLWNQDPYAVASDRKSVTATRNRAARLGWAPPAAWDDDVDDPAAVPHGVPARRAA